MSLPTVRLGLYGISSSLNLTTFVGIAPGRPTDPEGYRLKDVILEFARRLDEGGVPLTQLGIQFLQVGEADDATEALQELDGDLKGRVRNGEIRVSTLRPKRKPYEVWF